ncbi:MAG: c-type cytochrome [Acidiferrobacterales bacterium]|nr:c-type cytochrome [Acidiferrobacterales bacterium]
MRALYLFVLLCFGGMVFANDAEVIRPTSDFSKAEPYEALPAGALTHQKKLNTNAFSHASANMTFERELDFKIGNAFFRRIWVSSPASTNASDGLGPLFNARACQRCHIKDGRGHAPSSADDNAVSMLMRLSIPKTANDSEKTLTVPDPNYGGQLQDFSVAGINSEGQIAIEYTEIPIELNGGEPVSLRKPHFQIKNLMYGDLHQDIMLSPRVAPQMIGLGLLEAIAADDILSRQDIDDTDSDGISGKANWVWSPSEQKMMLGRFGLKAGQATLTDQNQAAFNGDLGLSTPTQTNAYGDCTPTQTACLQLPHGKDPQPGEISPDLEVSAEVVDQVLHYTRNLAVPARRDESSPDVLAGKKLFYQSNCIACHTPKFITPRQTVAPEQSRQLIWPYTDMLLHDMGEGLADNSPEGLANGSEWRTPPLWGIGLTPLVNEHTEYLHDGRARNLLEAILWHGGEAEQSKQDVVRMTPNERAQLIKFIESL